MLTEEARDRRHDRGAVLVEFALVIVVLYLLLAATVDLGRAFATQQLLESTARTAARELALRPLGLATTFDEALAQVFDPASLVVDLDVPCEESLDARFTRLPVANRMLRPLMITDRVNLGGERRTFLRYPGALVRYRTPPPPPPGAGAVCGISREYGVAIPRLAVDPGGADVLEWVAVVEEATEPSAFPLVAGVQRSGLVALRVHYPWQAGLIAAFRRPGGADGTGNLDSAVLAEDPAEIRGALPAGSELIGELDGEVPLEAPDGSRLTTPYRPYSGRLGLGAMVVAGQEVRPFSRLLSAQALFRREVFL